MTSFIQNVITESGEMLELRGHKAVLRHQARLRKKARNARTDEQQLALLEKRGAGLCNEAQRIRERLGQAQVRELDPPKAQPRTRPERKRRAKPASLM